MPFFAGGGNTQIQTAFNAADEFVRRGIASDFTGGALQFSHTSTPQDAIDIETAITNCGENVIRGIIQSAGIDPIVNGGQMVAGATNITVYINMNYTLPSAPSGAPSCP